MKGRQREGEEGVTSTRDCNKYVESNPLIRQQGVCGAIRFKRRVALPCLETEAWQGPGEDVCGSKNII